MPLPCHMAISIHLMLMLIVMEDFTEKGFANFNTSHVNVNRIFQCQMTCNPVISIHLMLMLILRRITTRYVLTLFQYISC